MSAGRPDPRSPTAGIVRLRALPAGSLLACLAALLAYLLLDGGAGRAPQRASLCLGQGAPSVVGVAAEELGELRASVARVLPERLGHLYEEGTIVGSTVWTDAAPAGPAVDPGERRPAGYEMRWWAPNGDDLVADVLVFSSPSTAARFLARAAAPRCSLGSLAGSADRPPQARNLAWTNPDDAAEADVYLARGRRVYRIADAPGGQVAGGPSVRDLGPALRTVDSLACLLPGAHCASPAASVPA